MVSMCRFCGLRPLPPLDLFLFLSTSHCSLPLRNSAQPPCVRSHLLWPDGSKRFLVTYLVSVWMWPGGQQIMNQARINQPRPGSQETKARRRFYHKTHCPSTTNIIPVGPFLFFFFGTSQIPCSILTAATEPAPPKR